MDKSQQEVISFIQKELNIQNSEYNLLTFQDNGKTIRIELDIFGEGKSYIVVNRRKDRLKIVTTG